MYFIWGYAASFKRNSEQEKSWQRTQPSGSCGLADLGVPGVPVAVRDVVGF